MAHLTQDLQRRAESVALTLPPPYFKVFTVGGDLDRGRHFGSFVATNQQTLSRRLTGGSRLSLNGPMLENRSGRPPKVYGYGVTIQCL